MPHRASGAGGAPLFYNLILPVHNFVLFVLGYSTQLLSSFGQARVPTAADAARDHTASTVDTPLKPCSTRVVSDLGGGCGTARPSIAGTVRRLTSSGRR
jgi:hypothetical protein